MTAKPPRRPVLRSVLRGLRRRCPRCGEGRIFERYLKPTPACARCREPYAHLRTDDFAPWLTIIVLGHIVVPVIYVVERNFDLPLWLQLALWVPLVAGLVLVLLPTAKGTCLGLMWALGLKGDERQ